jgi:hypothetical protein
MPSEERIRRRSNAIWGREGRPEGRHEEHWARARREIEAEADAPQGRRAAGTSPLGQSWGGTEGGAETEPPTGSRDGPRGGEDTEHRDEASDDRLDRRPGPDDGATQPNA